MGVGLTAQPHVAEGFIYYQNLMEKQTAVCTAAEVCGKRLLWRGAAVRLPAALPPRGAHSASRQLPLPRPLRGGWGVISPAPSPRPSPSATSPAALPRGSSEARILAPRAVGWAGDVGPAGHRSWTTGLGQPAGCVGPAGATSSVTLVQILHSREKGNVWRPQTGKGRRAERRPPGAPWQSGDLGGAAGAGRPWRTWPPGPTGAVWAPPPVRAKRRELKEGAGLTPPPAPALAAGSAVRV